jgi:hypothetical protein
MPYVESIDSYSMTASSGSITGHLFQAKQLGEVIITQGNTTLTKIVQADANGLFTLSLTAAESKLFSTAPYKIELDALSTLMPQAALQALAKISPTEIYKTNLAKNVGTVDTSIQHLDFQDLSTSGGGYTLINSSYHGYSLTAGGSNDIYVLNGSTYNGSSGYHNAAVESGKANVAYNGYANFPIDIKHADGTAFNFYGITLESAWESLETITISAYSSTSVLNNSTLLHSETVTLNNRTLSHITENWTNVKTVEITLVGYGTHLAITDLAVSG